MLIEDDDLKNRYLAARERMFQHRRKEWDNLMNTERFPLIDSEKAREKAGKYIDLLVIRTRSWTTGVDQVNEKGNRCRTYRTTIVTGGEKNFYEIQFVYNSEQIPIYANVEMTIPDPTFGLVVKYAQVSLENEPHLFYQTYPFHQDELARTEQDNVGADIYIEDLISRIPPEN